MRQKSARVKVRSLIHLLLKFLMIYRLKKMKLKFLKAGGGDSILIQTNGQNILIDGGDNPEFLFRQVEEIYANGQVIDLLVITHHDQDHIKGILELLKKIEKGEYGEPKKFIQKVFFNSPRKIQNIEIPEDTSELSYRQSYQTEKLISRLDLQWETCTDKTESIRFGDTKLHFLSPIVSDLEKYSEGAGDYLSSDYRSDWCSDLSTLISKTDDADLDNTLANRTSIVILLEHKTSRVLLTGDVTPARFNEVIENLVRQSNTETISFDYLKLPHHGSYRSLSKELLGKIQCKNFIVSTDSTKYKHPNKRAFAKIIAHSSKEGPTIKFHFNYQETMDNMGFSYKDTQLNYFELIPNNKDYGIEFSNF
jgi:beta-lactamase superfamily II metal-dependent hydrolase